MSKQDAAMVRRISSGILIAVCDGLGSRPKSDFGAQQACRAVRDVFDGTSPIPVGYTLCESIQTAWLHRVRFETAEATATTCLFAHVNAAGNATVVQLGDGLILCRSRGKFINVTPERRGFSNQTLALSDDFDPREWVIHNCELVAPGDGIVMMTDGISEDIDHERLEAFFEEIRIQALNKNNKAMRRWLTQQLHDWPTPGHSDDKSIAAFFRGCDND